MITYLTGALNFSSREWKQYYESGGWVLLGDNTAGSHAAADQVPVCWSLDFNWTFCVCVHTRTHAHYWLYIYIYSRHTYTQFRIAPVYLWVRNNCISRGRGGGLSMRHNKFHCLRNGKSVQCFRMVGSAHSVWHYNMSSWGWQDSDLATLLPLFNDVFRRMFGV